MTVKTLEKSSVEQPLQIGISRQFSRFPAGRYADDGPFSGQAFREKLLIPAMKSGKQVIIDLDGTAGFGSSFLEEAFGGLIRAGWSSEEVLGRMKFTCGDPSVIEEITDYIKSATPEDGKRE